MEFVLLVAFIFLLALARRRADRGAYLTVVVAAGAACYLAMR